MNNVNIELWIKSLGKTYEDLKGRGLIPDKPLIELYAGRAVFNLEPIAGIDMEFSDASYLFKKLFITLKKTTPSTIEFDGDLPLPFKFSMTRDDVRMNFSAPYKMQPPITMPEPMGPTGGWEAYEMDADTYPGVSVVFQYTADMQVDTLVFFLRQ